jgi:hypothetical protein
MQLHAEYYAIKAIAMSLHAISSLVEYSVLKRGPYLEPKFQPYEHCHNHHVRGVSDIKSLVYKILW